MYLNLIKLYVKYKLLNGKSWQDISIVLWNLEFFRLLRNYEEHSTKANAHYALLCWGVFIERWLHRCKELINIRYNHCWFHIHTFMCIHTHICMYVCTSSTSRYIHITGKSGGSRLSAFLRHSRYKWDQPIKIYVGHQVSGDEII